MRLLLALASAIAVLAALPAAAERPYEDERDGGQGRYRGGGRILVVATDMRDRLLGCRVVFRLANRTGRPIGRAMFKVRVGESGVTRRVYLWTGSYKDHEFFTATPCGQVRQQLRLVGAWCRWRGTLRRSDCTPRTRLLFERPRRW